MGSDGPQVLVADSIAEEGIQVLREGGLEVTVRTGLTQEELVREIPPYAGLMVRSATQVTEKILEAAASLRVVARAGAGVDNIDADAATRRGVVVVNSPGGNTIAAAELTMAHLLALSRNLPAAAESVRDGEWERGRFTGVEVFRKTLGLVGLGKIGSEVARRAQAFGMQVIACDPYVSQEAAARLGVRLVGWEELLATSDYISIHCPLTEATRGLIGKAEFGRMKDGVRLINTARGGIVDEHALLAALNSGKVGGAGVDVFEVEPPGDHPLLAHPSVVGSPHLGASTEEAQVRVACDVAEQVVEVLSGHPARSAVNLPNLSASARERALPFILLAEKMGALHAGLLRGRPQRAELKWAGEVAAWEVGEYLTRAFLKGFLAPVLGEAVTLVNAAQLAAERGLSVSASTHPTAGDYTSLLMTTVIAAGARRLEGTVFGAREPRIVSVNGFRLDLVPHGDLLFVTHVDAPGMTGRIGTLLGSLDINIAGMAVGREAPRGKAVMVLQLDSAVPPDVVRAIAAMERISSATYVNI